MATDDLDLYETARSVRADILDIDSKETFDLLNKLFVGIFRWDFEALLERARKVQEE